MAAGYAPGLLIAGSRTGGGQLKTPLERHSYGPAPSKAFTFPQVRGLRPVAVGTATRSNHHLNSCSFLFFCPSQTNAKIDIIIIIHILIHKKDSWQRYLVPVFGVVFNWDQFWVIFFFSETEEKVKVFLAFFPPFSSPVCVCE